MESPISKRVGAQSTLPTKSSVIQAQKKADNTISFTVTGLGKVDPNNILNLSALSDVGSPEKAVFKRLGGSVEPRRRSAVKRAATSTQANEPIAVDAAPYIGVLKDGGSHAASPKRLKLAVGARSGSGFAVSRLAVDSVRNRLGATPPSSHSASPKITRTLVRPSSSLTVSSSSIKKRLGAAAESAVSSSTDDMTNIKITRKISTPGNRRKSATTAVGVFSRLGRR